MITEYRSIIFSNDELVKALRPIVEARGLSVDLIPSTIEMGLDPHQEEEIQVTYGLGSDKDDVVFNSREIGAAILNHCIERGIPLPRGCQKELAIRGDEIALVIRLENRTDDPAIEDDFE